MWRHSRISTDAAFFVLRLVHDKTERLESPEKTDTGKITDKKLRGEWVEMVFMTHATELEYLSASLGERCGSYDFIVGPPAPFRLRAGEIHCLTNSALDMLRHKRWSQALSSRLVRLSRRLRRPENSWYIIPRGRNLG